MAENKSHFKGFSVIEHLKKAREKGKTATNEFHGIEVPGHIAAGADSAKETSVYTLLLYIVANLLGIESHKTIIILASFLMGLFLWKVGRSAHLGWARLERIDNLVEEEKDEIENNRDEERDELKEMYRAKGFNEPLLTKIIEVLMADDNKLLHVMLEEELHVSMDAYVHPLKQAFGAGIGVLVGAFAAPIAWALSIWARR